MCLIVVIFTKRFALTLAHGGPLAADKLRPWGSVSGRDCECESVSECGCPGGRLPVHIRVRVTSRPGLRPGPGPRGPPGRMALSLQQQSVLLYTIRHYLSDDADDQYNDSHHFIMYRSVSAKVARKKRKDSARAMRGTRGDAENIGTTTGGRTGRASDIIPGGQYNSVAAAQTKTDRVISG